MKNRFILISLFMPLLAVLNGCISGEIGTGTDMFENNISLRAYELNEEEEWEEKDCDSSGMTIETVIGSDMIYNTYSSIGLKLANNKNEREITTIIFEIEVEETGYLNIAILTDSTAQYETGLRQFQANKSVSFIIADLSYPANTSMIYFRNQAPAESAEQYFGYATKWKLKYIQTIYNERG